MVYHLGLRHIKTNGMHFIFITLLSTQSFSINIIQCISKTQIIIQMSYDNPVYFGGFWYIISGMVVMLHLYGKAVVLTQVA